MLIIIKNYIGSSHITSFQNLRNSQFYFKFLGKDTFFPAYIQVYFATLYISNPSKLTIKYKINDTLKQFRIKSTCCIGILLSNLLCKE